VLHEDDGQITLLLAGSRALVSADGSVTKLAANLDPTSGDVRIYRTTAGAQEDITGLISSGRVGGLVSARDGALAQARTELDQLAFDISTAYNAVHSAGFGLDGATARNLFTPPSAVLGAAGAMRVSTDVADQPDWLAAATSAASVPGDNRNALALLALRDQAFAAGGTLTAQEAFSGIVASGGSAVQGALGDLDQADATLSQVEGLRQAMTGVSTDEEMISLMTYQRAYQASLRVIETADAMLQELMNMKR
jgi:flagellar hook-associated protein 1 FlgK